MSIKLDLSQFKHVKSDKNSSTLQHKQGHVLTLAHNALSPESQAQLKALSNISKEDETSLQADDAKHQARTKMSSGGGVHNEDPDLLGKSEAGLHVRKANKEQPGGKKQSEIFLAKKEHKANLEDLKSMPAPNIKGLSDGGSVDRTKNFKPESVERTKADAPGSTINDSIRSFFGAPSPTPAPQQQAKGGHIQHREPKYCQYCGGSVHDGACDQYADGGQVAEMSSQNPKQDKPHGTIMNYPQIRKDYLEKNKPKYGEHNKPKLADGGNVAPPGYNNDGSKAEPGLGDKIMDWAGPKAQQAAQWLANEDSQPQPQPPQQDQSQDQPPGWGVTAPQPQSQAMDNNSPADAEDSPEEAPQASPQQPAPMPAPVPRPAQQMPVAKPKSLQDHAMDLHKENAQTSQEMQQDLDAGHVSPKTYSDLFHYNKDGSEKSTLGKISTAFGMLLAGAGSGLAHQPNAMLNMMDKYIENDLSAQQKSAENRQNFLRINQADLKNKADIGLEHANARNTNIDANLKAFTQMQVTALHDLTQQVQNMPDGPQKQQGMMQLAMMNNGIQAGLGDWKSKAIAAGAAGRMLMGQDMGGQPGQQASNPEMNFHNQQAGLRAMGQGQVAEANEAHHLPGYSQPASGPIPQSARDQVLAHDKMEQSASQLKNFVASHGGVWDRLSPANRAIAAQMVLPIQAGFREGTLGTVYREGEQPLLDKAIHGQPLSLAQYFLQTEPKKLDQLRKTNQEQKNLSLKNLGIDPGSAYQNQTQQAQQAPQYKMYNGVKYMRGPNGEAIPVK